MFIATLTAHPAVVEAEEVKPLASLLQVRDPGLGRLGFRPNSARIDRSALSATSASRLDVAHTTRSSAKRTSTPVPRSAHCRSSRCR